MGSSALQREDNPDELTIFLGTAIYLTQTSVLSYLIATLLSQAQALNESPTA